MAESIRVFENSLKDYLINVQTDSYNTHGKIEQKYNNLKLYMDPKKTSVPHFWVSVNISAVCYQIDPIEKIDGSMGSDERFVTMWAGRPNINGELKKHWVYLTKSNELLNQQVQNEKKTEENMEISKAELKEAAESVTGSGVRHKLKAFEARLRKNRYGKVAQRARG